MNETKGHLSTHCRYTEKERTRGGGGEMGKREMGKREGGREGGRERGREGGRERGRRE